MTFHIIEAGDLEDAVVVMENFRHINYGTALLPVDFEGLPVDNTIDIGSSTRRFKDGYFSNKLNIGAVQNQAIINLSMNGEVGAASPLIYLNTSFFNKRYDVVPPGSISGFGLTSKIKFSGIESTVFRGNSNALLIEMASTPNAVNVIECSLALTSDNVNFGVFKLITDKANSYVAGSEHSSYLSMSRVYSEGSIRSKGNAYFSASKVSGTDISTMTVIYNKEPTVNTVTQVGGTSSPIRINVSPGYLKIDYVWNNGNLRSVFFVDRLGHTISLYNDYGPSKTILYDAIDSGYIYCDDTTTQYTVNIQTLV